MYQHLSNIAIDELGESLIDRFYTEHPNNSLCVDIEGFASEYLGLTIGYETFKERDVEGFLGDGETAVSVLRGNKAYDIVFPRKTVVISEKLLNPTMSGRKRFTMAHEVSHYLLDRMSPEMSVARYRRELQNISNFDIAALKERMSLFENRADRLAAALLMPRFNINKAMERFAGGVGFTKYGDTLYGSEEHTIMQSMADGMGVSREALEIRLRDMGLIEYKPIDDFIKQDLQEGDFDDSDIEYDRRCGQLDPLKTYLIHRSRREAERHETRVIKCPSCGFRMATVTVNSHGSQQLKCRKCGLNENLNLAYFRKRKPYLERYELVNYKKTKR